MPRLLTKKNTEIFKYYSFTLGERVLRFLLDVEKNNLLILSIPCPLCDFIVTI